MRNNPTRILVLDRVIHVGHEVFPENPHAFFINSVAALKKSLLPTKEYSIYVVDNLFGYDGISPNGHGLILATITRPEPTASASSIIATD